MNEMLDEIASLWQARDFGTHSVTVTHPEIVGWESTAPREGFASSGLEPFKPNRVSLALRVKTDCVNVPAPKTRELTLVFEFKCEDGTPVAVVHSIYPGSDIGELLGDVTERENRVFFDWNHPGE